jgi:hypothetical protein
MQGSGFVKGTKRQLLLKIFHHHLFFSISSCKKEKYLQQPIQLSGIVKVTLSGGGCVESMEGNPFVLQKKRVIRVE